MISNPIKLIRKGHNTREKRKKTKKKGKKYDDTGLAIKAPKTSCVPWVWFEAIVQRVAEAISPSCKYFVDYERALPLGIEFMLLLLWES